MEKYETYKQLLDVECAKPEKDWAAIEILHAQYTAAWHAFEDRVWAECRLPRHELMLKRANFG